MGRVYRNRKRKENRLQASKLGSDVSIVNLKKWLTKNGWIAPCKLEVALFPFIGRGMMANEFIRVGDVVAQVPLHLIITVHTVSKSELGPLFSQKIWNPQQVLAIFLIWEKHMRTQSFWHHYIRVLPVDYDSPVFTGSFENLPQSLIDKIISERCKILNYHREFLDNFKELICNHCNESYFKIFTEDLFLWAWFTVNSRCVYISSLDNLKHSIKLSESDTLALIPFLDLFNHSDNASVLAEVKNNCFQLTTNISFPKFNQVFIQYGNHSNTKLYLEYGFIIPNNPNDTVLLDLEEIIVTVNNFTGLNCSSEKKIQFLRSYLLNTDLQITNEGFSWCSINLIKVLLLPDKSLDNYSFINDITDVTLKDICKIIVESKLKCFNELSCDKKSNSPELNILFVKEMIKVLEKCNTLLYSLNE